MVDKKSPTLRPKLLGCLKTYTFATLLSDLAAGITVGLVSLPLAMAFAISSGVPPEFGLYTAVVAGFLISALGGSKTQIGGPTGAFVVIVYGIVAKYGLNGLLVSTMMAGGMLLFLGLTGLGSAIKFIPRPVVIGFTNGIAVLIASTQIKDFLGLEIEAVPGEFLGRMGVIGQHLETISPLETGLAVGSLAVILVMRRWVPRIPGAIVAMVAATAAVWLLALPVQTIGGRFGGIPAGLPALKVPEISLELMAQLTSPALTIALLGAIESLLSAVVADRMSKDKHNPNMELVAQGIANLAVPFVGGIPATGAIARTATNIRSGARTPVAGLFNALTLLVILLVAAPLADRVPLACLAAILVVVAYNMGEWREIPKLLSLSWTTRAVWFATFALTVLADLTIAVQVGLVLAALLFIRKVARTSSVSLVTPEYIREGQPHILQDKDLPPDVAIVRIHGPFLFGMTEQLTEVIDSIPTDHAFVVIRLRNMTAIDATGLLVFEEVADRLHAEGRHMILCGAHPQPAFLMKQAKFERHVGQDNIRPNIQSALERVREIRKLGDPLTESQVQLASFAAAAPPSRVEDQTTTPARST